MNKIKFISDKPYNFFKQEYKPSISAKFIPKWFLNASKYHIDKNMKEQESPFVKGDKILGFKSCPALMDGYTMGYVLVTPCDIEFKNINNKKQVIVPKDYEDFCGSREPMYEFNVPEGYDKNHFHWWPNWSFQTPIGYSTLVVHPLNHYDLPFITTSGIIDSDQWTNSGLFPFFVLKDFEGVIPAGTPFVQILPYKREDWQAEYEYSDQKTIMERRQKNNELRYFPGGGKYKEKYRQRKIYR